MGDASLIMPIYELPELRDRKAVFRNRVHAGRVLAGLMEKLRGGGARLLAIPAGGAPVAAEIARELSLPLSVAVSSKITPPWNTELGYGAVAFDDTVIMDEALALRMGIEQEELREGIRAARERVRRRAAVFGTAAGIPDLAESSVVLVDDGLASGVTILAALAALRKAGASSISIAVPTGHEQTVLALAREVDELYCPNVRGGPSFAVADAYERWHDVSESEAVEILRSAQDDRGGARPPSS